MAKENKTVNALKQLEKEITNFNERLYNIPELDGYYSDLIDDINANEKMTKKQRKELAIKTLKERMPKVYALLFEIDLISEAISSRIEELHSDIEDKESELSEIEEEQEELQNRIDNLR